MNIGAFIITGIMLLLWDGVFGFAVWASLREKGRRKWFGVVGGLMVMWGVTSFFLTGLCSDCGTDIVPSRFEWPMGLARGIIATPSGLHIVPNDAAGRVQIYDANWKFIRGWHIDAHGGVFKLALLPEERFEVITARGQSRFSYAPDGTLVSSTTYSGNFYGSMPESKESRWIPTWPWLLPLAHPFVAFLTMVCGIVVLVVGGKTDVRFFKRRAA